MPVRHETDNVKMPLRQFVRLGLFMLCLAPTISFRYSNLLPVLDQHQIQRHERSHVAGGLRGASTNILGELSCSSLAISRGVHQFSGCQSYSPRARFWELQQIPLRSQSRDELPSKRIVGETCDIMTPLTRSESIGAMISSISSVSGLGFLGATLFTARSVEAVTGEADKDVTVKDGGTTPEDGDITLTAPSQPAYTMGPDEFGVLFGDGPVGLKLGDNPLKASGVCRVFVTEVLTGSQAIRQSQIRAGLGVAAVGGQAAASLGPKDVAALIRSSPRPMEIIFREPNLLAKRLQDEADGKAAEEKRRSRMGSSAAPETSTEVPSSSPMEDGPGGTLRVTQVGPKPALCNTRTKAGDLIEFRYSARLASDLSVEFDSSDRRGTGLPYAIVMGNGDVVRGLDISLFDMCVGERRRIEIPARLAFGEKGSKAFGVPPDDGKGAGAVVYGVELVSINFSSDPAAKRDNFYTDDPCSEAAIEAGNGSRLCRQRSPTSVQRSTTL